MHIFKSNQNQITFIVTSPANALVSEILESVLQTVQKNNLHIDSTYLQTYTGDNVQKKHIHILSTQCTIKTYLVINTHYTPYVHILHYVHIYT